MHDLLTFCRGIGVKSLVCTFVLSLNFPKFPAIDIFSDLTRCSHREAPSHCRLMFFCHGLNGTTLLEQLFREERLAKTLFALGSQLSENAQKIFFERCQSTFVLFSVTAGLISSKELSVKSFSSGERVLWKSLFYLCIKNRIFKKF